jgi:hypothetical protein
MRPDSYQPLSQGLVTTRSEPAPHRREDLMRYSADRETFLYDRQADVIHVLNPTALAVWELCDGAHSPAQIAGYLATHFAGVPEGEADGAVRALLTTLEQKTLIQWEAQQAE